MSPLDLGRAISRDEEKRVTAAGGNMPLVMAKQADRRQSAVHLFVSKAFKCSKRQPEQPAPEPLGALRIALCNTELDKLIVS